MSSPPRSEAEEIIRLNKELEWAHLKIRVLEERLRLQRIEKYGPKSEKLSDAQLELLEAEPGVCAAEIEAESTRERLPATAAESTPSAAVSGKRRHPGRQALPAGLPPRRTHHCLHAGPVHLQQMRQRNMGYRL